MVHGLVNSDLDSHLSGYGPAGRSIRDLHYQVLPTHT